MANIMFLKYRVYAGKVLFRALVFAVIPLLLQGCYGDMQIRKTTERGGSFNEDSTKVLFYAFLRAMRPAKGLPETPITRYRNASLYLYDIDVDDLSRIMDFGRIPYSGSRWTMVALFAGDSIAFRITPLQGWEKEIAMGMDTALAVKHGAWYIARPNGKLVRRTDSFDPERATGHPYTMGELNTIIADIPFEKWQADVGHIFPRRRSRRISQIVELYGNQNYRDALILHMAPGLTERDIDRLIERIDRRYSRLDEPGQRRNANAREQTVSMLRRVAGNLN